MVVGCASEMREQRGSQANDLEQRHSPDSHLVASFVCVRVSRWIVSVSDRSCHQMAGFLASWLVYDTAKVARISDKYDH